MVMQEVDDYRNESIG